MKSIERMLKIINGKHWWSLDYNAKYLMETDDSFRHVLRFPKRPFKKRKYYIRKKYFIKYESHRKKGVDYLPF